MAKYIDAEALKELFADSAALCNDIDEFPAADVRENRHGWWIDDMPWIEQHHSLRKGLTYRCSECGHRTGTYKHKTYNYCPNCGADMRGGDAK